MDKPVVIVDLDNVLSRSAEGFVEFSNKHFGTALTIEDYSEDWCKMWGVTFDEAERRGEFMRVHHIHSGYEPVAGAFEAITHLQQNFRLVILTSRRKAVELDTTEWLEKYFPGAFQELMFSGIWDDTSNRGGHLLSKGERYRELEAQFVIDDHLKHCESATKVGIPAVLFGNYPWNQADSLPKLITRCADWKTVLEYFDGIGRR